MLFGHMGSRQTSAGAALQRSALSLSAQSQITHKANDSSRRNRTAALGDTGSYSSPQTASRDNEPRDQGINASCHA
eukprot:1674796-Heterocapsa_arctica.AAC.1